MALDALAVGIQTRKVSYVLDADIRGFFDTLDHGWLIQFLGHRIADRRVLRHIQKWLNAGVMEDGKRGAQEEGTPQGGGSFNFLGFTHACGKALKGKFVVLRRTMAVRVRAKLAALDRFRDRVRRLWHRTLNRRSETARLGEATMSRIDARWLPSPRICQPYPEQRLAVIIQGKSPVR